MKRFLLAALFALGLTPAFGQSAVFCPTRPPGDNSNACASTAWVTANGGGGGGSWGTVGTSVVTGAANGNILYNNAGVLGAVGITGSGLVMMQTSPTILGHPTIEGVTSSGATGSGSLVFGATPTLSNPTVTGSFTATGLVTNADLVSASTTVNGQTCTLGLTCTITASAGTITIGSTTVASATNGNILFNNAGTLGQYTITGSGNAVLGTSPTISAPTISGHPVVEGVTSTGATGTGNFVFATAPTVSSLTVGTAFTAPNLVTNAALAQGGAATLKGNPTNALANVTDFTIQGLTARGSPDATNDKIPIYDNAAGTIKYVTPGAIASAATSGVSSIDSGTGAFTCTGGVTCPTNNIKLANIANGHVLANGTGGTAAAQDTTAPTWFDQAWCNTVGYLIARTTGGWVCSNAIPANVMWFNAKGDGTTDDSTAFTNAIATGNPVYIPKPSSCFKITFDLTMQASQSIGGEGDTSKICVLSNAGFTNGLFNCNTTQPGNRFHDFRVVYTQATGTTAFNASIPNGSAVMTVSSFTGGVALAVGQYIIDASGAGNPISQGAFISSFGTGAGGNGTYNLSWTNVSGSAITTRAVTTPDNLRPQFTQYVPTFKCRNAPRVVMQNIQVENAWVVGDFQNNSGGFVGDNLRFSPLSFGLMFDGSLDTVRVNNYHCWPYGMNALQTGMFESARLAQTPGTDYTACLYLGRVDGFFASEFFDLAFLGVYMFHGTLFTAGDCICNLTNSGFDSFNGIIQNSGQLNLSNSYFSHFLGNYVSLSQAGSSTNARLSNIYWTNQSTLPLIIQQACTSCILLLDNFHVNNGGSTNLFSIAANTQSDYWSMSHGYIDALPNNVSVFNAPTPNAGATNTVHVSDIYTVTTSNVAYSTPIYNYGSNIRVTQIGTRLADKGTGAGTFITTPGACQCYIVGNDGPGWGYGGALAATSAPFFANNLQ